MRSTGPVPLSCGERCPVKEGGRVFQLTSPPAAWRKTAGRRRPSRSPPAVKEGQPRQGRARPRAPLAGRPPAAHSALKSWPRAPAEPPWPPGGAYFRTGHRRGLESGALPLLVASTPLGLQQQVLLLRCPLPVAGCAGALVSFSDLAKCANQSSATCKIFYAHTPDREGHHPARSPYARVPSLTQNGLLTPFLLNTVKCFQHCSDRCVCRPANATTESL